MELFTGQTPASHLRQRDRQVHLLKQREVHMTCMKMLHSQPSQRLTVSQAPTEMANIGETVEYSAGDLRVTDGRAGARCVADDGAVAAALRAGNLHVARCCCWCTVVVLPASCCC